MSLLLADTNVWSLAYRSDTDRSNQFVSALGDALNAGTALTTGVVYLELLRGFTRRRTRDEITELFTALPLIEPSRSDYAAAADLSLICRSNGVQLETVDALVAQVCIANDLTLLTSDADFTHAARHIPLDVWSPA